MCLVCTTVSGLVDVEVLDTETDVSFPLCVCTCVRVCSCVKNILVLISGYILIIKNLVIPFMYMKYRCLALSFTVIAWIFSVITVAFCEYMEAEFNFSSYYYNVNHEASIGLFRHGSDCVDDEDTLGSGHEAAQAFGVICSLFGGIVLVIMVLGLFLPLPVPLWRTVSVTLFVLAPFQLFTFSIFEDCPENYDCTIGTGAASAVVAFIFWIVAGIFTCRMPMIKKAVIPCCNNSGGGCCSNDGGGCSCCDQPSTEAVPMAVPVVESAPPEPSAPPAPVPGTQTVTEEVVHPDGRRTVTTTTVVIEQ